MAGAGATLLRCVLLAAAGGLRLCSGTERLEGLRGQSLSFPALHLLPADIARVTWRSRGTHIAQAKPREKMFAVDYLPGFRGRLFIHPTSLSLKIAPLEPGDGGRYEVVVDTFSDPTNPKTFSYFLMVYDGSAAGTGDTGGHGGSTVEPRGATKPHTGDPTTRGTGGGNPPDGSGVPAACRVWDRYCVVKGCLVATIFGALLMVVATVHVMTRDKGGEQGDGGSAGPGIAAPQGPSLWQR